MLITQPNEDGMAVFFQDRVDSRLNEMQDGREKEKESDKPEFQIRGTLVHNCKLEGQTHTHGDCR